jgi:hypothetical protein
MGFIPQTNTKTLYAYLTTLGRQYILDGDKEDFQVEFFSLHDDDVNYFISSNISAGTAYYTLQSGFIPDITGDNDSCIKSIANGTRPNMLSTLSGSTVIDPITGLPTVGSIGAGGTVGGRNTVISGPANTTINGGTLDTTKPTQTLLFNVTISPPVGSTNTTPLTSAEISSSKFYVKITNPSPSNLIGNFRINNELIPINTNFLITPTSVSQVINIGYGVLGIPPASQTIKFNIVITSFNSANNVTTPTITYTATYPVGGGGGDGLGGGDVFSGPPIAGG